MKILKFFLSFFLFVAGVLLAAWFFMPWKQLGESVLLFAAQQVPFRVAYASVWGVSGGSFRTLTVVPDVTSSLLNMALVCRFVFTGVALGDIAVTPRKKIPGVFLGNGRATLSLTAEEVLLEGLRSDGELALNGVLLLAPSGTPIIRRADVTLAVSSEPFEKELPSLQMAFSLPLRQEAPGRWSFRRGKGEAR